MVNWARAAFPYAGSTLSPACPTGVPHVEKAAYNLVTGLQLYASPTARADALYRIGVGLNGLARHLNEEGAGEGAGKAFKVAYAVLTSAYGRAEAPDHFKKAVGFSFANLQALGQSPLGEGENLPEPGDALLDLNTVLGTSSVESGGEGLERLDGRVQPGPRRYLAISELLEELRKKWSTSDLLRMDVSDQLAQYLGVRLAGSGVGERDLGRLFRDDLTSLADIVCTLPADRETLQVGAREFRHSAFQAGDDERERRQRWLLAAVFNHALWKKPAGLPTNEPQVIIDLMGYVGAILMDRRYSDVDRDLLLDCAEAQVRLAHDLAAVVFARFPFLPTWTLAAVGTYLLLAGPDPASPSDSYYDERIVSALPMPGRGLQRAERQAWAEILLGAWQPSAEDALAASHALASVSGWDSARGRWLINLIYDRSRDDQRDLSRAYWLAAHDDLLERTRRVRIATNPWGTQGTGAARDSMITTDETGRFRVPDSVLRAAAAQGLREGEVATVHGKVFQGRRVPTYLLSNRFGPYAILKLDHREKVVREMAHFDQFARRLHQSHRPSECRAHPMDLYLGESGEALRAIETAYVFEQHDEPLTLREWIIRNDGQEAPELLKEFLLEALRPWLAHVRRDRVDLRLEYPVFRPAIVDGRQAPGSWAGTELERLETAEPCEGLAVTPRRSGRDCPWLEDLPGTGALAALGTPVNPLWFAAEIAEIGTGALTGVIDARDISLRDVDTLVSLCHGDLHLDNVLCATARRGRPNVVLIDFESAHHGHVCKDIARLEASLLCQLATLGVEAEERVMLWFIDSTSDAGAVFRPREPGDDGLVGRMLAAVRVLREVIAGCGQGHWPIRYDEYLLALVGALLPMARYTTLTPVQRRMALVLSTAAATRVTTHWEMTCS